MGTRRRAHEEPKHCVCAEMLCESPSPYNYFVGVMCARHGPRKNSHFVWTCWRVRLLPNVTTNHSCVLWSARCLQRHKTTTTTGQLAGWLIRTTCAMLCDIYWPVPQPVPSYRGEPHNLKKIMHAHVCVCVCVIKEEAQKRAIKKHVHWHTVGGIASQDVGVTASKV